MTDTALRHSYTRDAIDLFTSRPGERFDYVALSKVLGFGGWRTRLSQARIQLEAAKLGTIRNEQPRDERGTRRTSVYFFEPWTNGQPRLEL